MENDQKEQGKFTDEEVARRRDRGLKRMLAMRPQPKKDDKASKKEEPADRRKVG